ncbi:hypothetical protein DL771_005727 [Monosporascus sp. 5C6A]|nr:hypothetical protein DL771_005727 [Monosporascus sp. 5C6A]
MTSKDSFDHRALLEKIESIVNDAQNGTLPHDKSIRRRLGQAGLKLSLAMEAPHDTMYRIGNTPLQLALAYVGNEKGIFKFLSEHDDTPLTNEVLARETKIDPALMSSDDSYGPSNITKNLTSQIGSAGLNFFQAYIAAPQFLREIGYADVVDPSFCAWNIAHQTEEPTYKWLQSHPELGEIVADFMAVQRDGLPSFLDAFAFDQELTEVTSDATPLFVDVGGGMGHQCIAFRQRYPTLPGRVILQDQGHVIERVESKPLPGFKESGIEAQIHDFFTPQPIKGARAYYLRNILHNYTDDACRQILEGIKLSMTQHSVILVDEMVLSESHAPARASQMDMCMFTCLAAKERSEREWQELLGKAGLRILKQCKYADEFQEAVLVVIPK